MARLDSLKSQLRALSDQIKDSQAYQQLRAKYDDLDTQTKSYIQLGITAGVALVILLSVSVGMGKVAVLKSEMNDKEELIGYLQRSADEIQRVKAQASANQGEFDASTPLNSIVEIVLGNSGLNKQKFEVGQEATGAEDKTSKETFVEVKLNQINLRQLVRVLYSVTEKGASRGLLVKNLTVDTKEDPTGYIDASFAVAVYNAK